MNHWKQLKAKVERLLKTYALWQTQTGTEAQRQTTIIKSVIKHNLIQMKHENPRSTYEFTHHVGIELRPRCH